MKAIDFCVTFSQCGEFPGKFPFLQEFTRYITRSANIRASLPIFSSFSRSQVRCDSPFQWEFGRHNSSITHNNQFQDNQMNGIGTNELYKSCELCAHVGINKNLSGHVHNNSSKFDHSRMDGHNIYIYYDISLQALFVRTFFWSNFVINIHYMTYLKIN